MLYLSFSQGYCISHLNGIKGEIGQPGQRVRNNICVSTEIDFCPIIMYYCQMMDTKLFIYRVNQAKMEMLDQK